MHILISMSGLHFSIGTCFPKKKSKKEKVKKLLKKLVCNSNLVYLPASPKLVQISSIPKFYVQKELWKIPETIQVSSSVQSKFLFLSYIYSYKEIINMLKESLRKIRFKYPESRESFEIPKAIKSQIVSYYSRQENEWNKVRGIYLRLFRFKAYIQPLIHLRRIKKTVANRKNTEDPVLMEIPKKPVYILDIKRRMSFVYDARSLIKAIEHRLLFSDYMFAEPQEPVNLLTNEPLTYGQIISVIRQCKQHGEFSWLLDELRIHEGDLKKFATFNRQKLNLEAINIFFKKSVYVIRETVLDFFGSEADIADLPNYKIFNFIKKYDTDPNHPLIQKWIRHTKDYYIAKELNDNSLLAKNSINTDNLLNSVHFIF